MFIFILTDNLDATKALRSVSKIALSASYEYFNILLREPVTLRFNQQNWFINDDNNYYEIGHTFTPLHNIHKSISYKTPIKDLFISIKTSDNLKGILFTSWR